VCRASKSFEVHDRSLYGLSGGVRIKNTRQKIHDRNYEFPATSSFFCVSISITVHRAENVGRKVLGSTTELEREALWSCSTAVGDISQIPRVSHYMCNFWKTKMSWSWFVCELLLGSTKYNSVNVNQIYEIENHFGSGWFAKFRFGSLWIAAGELWCDEESADYRILHSERMNQLCFDVRVVGGEGGCGLEVGEFAFRWFMYRYHWTQYC